MKRLIFCILNSTDCMAHTCMHVCCSMFSNGTQDWLDDTFIKKLRGLFEFGNENILCLTII